MAKIRITQTKPYDSPDKLTWLSNVKDLKEIPMASPLTWASIKYKWGGVKSVIFENDGLLKVTAAVTYILWKHCKMASVLTDR